MNQNIATIGDSPLEILLKREAIKEAVDAVRTQKKYRDIRQRRWWKDHFPFLFPGLGPVNGFDRRSEAAGT